MRLHTLFRSALVTALAAGALVVAPVLPASAAATPVGVLSTITPGLPGFDSLTVENQTQINCLSQTYGYAYDMINTNDLTVNNFTEYNAAATAGMKVVLFQGYYQPYWKSATYGTSQGTKAAAAAAKVNYPAHGQIFLNLEATTNSTRSIMLGWVKNWAAEVNKAGYVAGVYVGANPGLTAADLNTVTGVSVYWKSASTSGVPVPARGYVQQQPLAAFEVKRCTTTVDGNIAGTDRNGMQLVGAAFPHAITPTSTAGSFTPLASTRLLDTRSALGAPGPVGGNEFVDLQVTTRATIPSTATSVVLNVTVTAPTASGYLSVYPTPSDNTPPSVSNLNFAAGQTIANLVTVKVGAGGKVRLFNGSNGTSQILADVAGYYVQGTASAAGTYAAATAPTRLLDTRPNPAAGGSTTAFAVTGVPGLPAAPFDSAVLNLTAVVPAGSGYLIAYATGTGRPTASNLNFFAGQSVANMATVPVGTGTNAGKVSLYNGSAGRTDLIADVAGVYLSGTRAVPGAFTATAPTRVLDTRSNLGHYGKVAAVSAISVRIAGTGLIVPAGASAVVLNITTTDQATSGYLTAFPSDRSAPVASNINFVAKRDIANQVIVPIGTDGRVVLYNQSLGSTDLIADIAGYFRT